MKVMLLSTKTGGFTTDIMSRLHRPNRDVCQLKTTPFFSITRNTVSDAFPQNSRSGKPKKSTKFAVHENKPIFRQFRVKKHRMSIHVARIGCDPQKKVQPAESRESTRGADAGLMEWVNSQFCLDRHYQLRCPHEMGQ